MLGGLVWLGVVGGSMADEVGLVAVGGEFFASAARTVAGGGAGNVWGGPTSR